MKKILCLIAVVLFIDVSLGFSQEEEESEETPSNKELLKDAESYFEKENYIAALPIYLQLDDLDPDIEYKYKIGICYLYKTDEKQKSIEYLDQVFIKKPKTEDLYFYLGRAYHLNNHFDVAINYFNDAKKKKTSKENEALIDRLIENCENGIILVAEPLDIEIENIGRPINTEYKEYVPVISADESVLIFTYRGEKSTGGLQNKYAEPDPKGQNYEDVFISYMMENSDKWMEPERIGENINTHGHDASLALSANGQKLFIYKDTEGSSGDIYVSNLEGYTWSEPVRLDTTINSEYWEGNVTLSADENTLYFASERPGGLGGRDLYKSMKTPEGNWGEAMNLGPTINTPYDDDSPFIHADAKMLYFSSQGHNSMGGFDIFRSVLQDDSNWSTPENVGYPINTTDDDKYYVVSASGKRGYYSSAKLGGYGQHDIYIAHLGVTAKKHALILVKGKVTANDQPAEAEINVTYADDNIPHEGYYKSNSATGKYIVILPAESNYNLSYEVDGYPPHIEKVSAAEIFTFMEMVINVKLYSEDFVHPLSLAGNVYYRADPEEPAVNVTVYITNDDGSVSEQTVTVENGFFKFEDLPSGQAYKLSLDINGIIAGEVLSNKKPKEGVRLNDTMSKEDGSFRLDIGGAPGIAEEKPVVEKPKSTGFPVQYLIPFSKNATNYVDFSDAIYQKIIAKYGNSTADGLFFKVQIGAYFTPENFNYAYFNNLGNVGTQIFKDGITRFTIGKYKTLNQTQKIRQKAVKIGDKDAFITIFYNGERKLLSEMIANEL